MNKDYKEIIEKAFNLIQRYKKVNEDEVSIVFKSETDEKFQIFLDFYYEFTVLSSMYLYKDIDDPEQMELSDKFNEVNIWIIANKHVFKDMEYYNHIPSMIIGNIMDREESHLFSLMADGRKKDLIAEREHFKLRSKIERIIYKNIEGNLSSSELRFLNSNRSYMKNYYSNAISLYEKNFGTVSEQELLSFLQGIEYSGYLNRIIYSDEGKISFEDTNLVYQYIRFVLKMKSIFQPEELLKDPIIQGVYRGKIRNSRIVNLIFSSEETKQIEKRENKKIGNAFPYKDIFEKLLKRDSYDISHFYINLIEHLQEYDMDDKNIQTILEELLLDDDVYDPLQFLVDISQVQEEVSIFNHPTIMRLLREKEEKVFKGRSIYIPFEYAMKNLKILPAKAIDNLIVSIENGGYNEERTIALKQALIDNGLFKPRETIEFDRAKQLIKQCLDREIELDEKTCKSCITTIVTEELRRDGIDIGSSVFFGEDDKNNGVHFAGKKAGIWINNDLVMKLIDPNSKEKDKSRIFITMFHEMRHVRQFRNMKDGNIDFLTYNFIKEEVIRKFDSNFYDANYSKIFIEEDARQYGIVDAMRFLNGLGIKDFDKIYGEYKDDLESELKRGNLSKDSVKHLPFRKSEKMDISEYLGRIIRRNPEILGMYHGILKIEYNLDGSRKDIIQLLGEFYAIRDERIKESRYPIYYGILKKLSREDTTIRKNPILREQLDDFFEQDARLISVNDMLHYLKKSDPVIRKVVMSVFEREILGSTTKVADRDTEDNANLTEKGGDKNDERDLC